MTVPSQLASAHGRRDEVPNQELAIFIVKNKDKNAVKELVENLTNKSKGIQSDCIKVLYEIGESEPSMIADYTKDFITLLDSKNNRMIWGAVSAIHSITLTNPHEIFKALPKIMDTANNGSVITKDQTVGILIKLCSLNEFLPSAFPLLIEIITTCPTNQLPMYAENAMPIINSKNKDLFIKTLLSRLDEIEKDTKRIRVEKVIKKLG